MLPKKSGDINQRGQKRPVIGDSGEEKMSIHDDDEDREMDEHKGDEIEERLKKKHKSVPMFECPICLNECERTSNQIRVLPCAHSICRECGIELIQRNEQKNTLRCPDCHQPHILDHPNIEFDSAVLIDRYPTMEQFLNRNEWLMPTQPVHFLTSTAAAAAASSSPSSVAASVAATKVFYCTYERCTKLATHICLVCGYQCAEHEWGIHLDRSSHSRMSLEEQKQKQLKEDANLQHQRKQHDTLLLKHLEGLNSQLTLELKDADELEHQARETDAKRYRDRLYNEIELLTKFTNTIKQNHFARFALQTSLLNTSKTLHQELTKAIDAKTKEIDELMQSSADDRARMSEDEIKKLLNWNEVKHAASQHQQFVESIPSLPPSHPLITLIRQLTSPTILPTLTPPQRKKLDEMLAKSGKSCAKTMLLYRASCDGWTKNDLIHCCRGKRETLLLVKVAGNGFIWGVYIAPRIPDPDIGEKLVVSDRTLHV